MTGSRFVDITPCSGGEWKKSISSFLGGELSLLKLGSVLVGLSVGVAINIAKLLFEVKCPRLN